MENRTAKITRTVFVSEWSNPKGGQIYYHEIELDNGEKGQIGSKDKMPAKLNPGQELTYTLEQTAHGPKIKAVLPAGGFKGRATEDPKVKMIGFAASYVKDLVCAGKVDMKDFQTYFDKMYTLLTSKL